VKYRIALIIHLKHLLKKIKDANEISGVGEMFDNS
jgi:hypothetical protein